MLTFSIYLRYSGSCQIVGFTELFPCFLLLYDCYTGLERFDAEFQGPEDIFRDPWAKEDWRIAIAKKSVKARSHQAFQSWSGAHEWQQAVLLRTRSGALHLFVVRCSISIGGLSRFHRVCMCVLLCALMKKTRPPDCIERVPFCAEISLLISIQSGMCDPNEWLVWHAYFNDFQASCVLLFLYVWGLV